MTRGGDMLLDLHESRVAVAALQTLERALADDLEERAEPGLAGTSDELRSAYDRHEIIATLVKKLATAGEHRVDRREIELISAGLERYLNLLEAPEGAHGDSDDFLRNPDPAARQAERRRCANLFEKLTGHDTTL